MRIPFFKDLKDEKGVFNCTPPPHPNPYFYKFKMRVFWRGSRNEGYAFLGNKRNLMSIHDGCMLVDQLKLKEEPCYLYFSGGVLRRDLSEKGLLLKIDPTNPRWARVDFDNLAPAFDDDPDPVYSGFK